MPDTESNAAPDATPLQLDTAAEKKPLWAVWRWPLHSQILLGLVCGALIGYLMGRWAVGGDRSPDQAVAAVTGSFAFMLLELAGDLFLNGLKLIIVPLVVSSIVLALINIGSGAGVGRLGIKTLCYYMTTSLLAIVVGLTLVNIVAPGIQGGVGILAGDPSQVDVFAQEQDLVSSKTDGRSASDFLDVFRKMIPSNLFSAASDNGRLLGLIVVALIVGFFLARMDSEEGKTLVRLTQGVYDLSMKVTDLVLRFAPIGVLGLLGATISEQYAKLVPDARLSDFISGIVAFAGVAVAALAVHALVTMPIILMVLVRVNPLKHYKAMASAIITAFSTASSSATLPVTIECVEENAKVSKKTASFVLPLGATVNMDGTALYECVAAMFICQAFGIDLSISQQFLVVITALLTSIGVAGVPSASLVAIVIILQAVQANLPEDALPKGVLLTSGLGLLMVFDRPLDMCRTAVNIFSDSVGAVVIAKSEGEKVLEG